MRTKAQNDAITLRWKLAFVKLTSTRKGAVAGFENLLWRNYWIGAKKAGIAHWKAK